jgi:hypothetical protein
VLSHHLVLSRQQVVTSHRFNMYIDTHSYTTDSLTRQTHHALRVRRCVQCSLLIPRTFAIGVPESRALAGCTLVRSASCIEVRRTRHTAYVAGSGSYKRALTRLCDLERLEVLNQATERANDYVIRGEPGPAWSSRRTLHHLEEAQDRSAERSKAPASTSPRKVARERHCAS